MAMIDSVDEKKERIAGLWRTAAEAVSEADVAQIMRAMVDKAAAGSVNAARIVLQYALGKPATKTTTSDPTTPKSPVESLPSNGPGTPASRTPSSATAQAPTDPPLAEQRARRKDRSATRSWSPSLAEMVMNNASRSLRPTASHSPKPSAASSQR